MISCQKIDEDFTIGTFTGYHRASLIHIIMSATTTVLASSAVSTDDIELVAIDHIHRTGENDLRSTQTIRKTGRDWKLLFQLISCGVSFFVAGVNDGSLGALLPYIIRSYGLTTAIASSVFVVLLLPLPHDLIRL